MAFIRDERILFRHCDPAGIVFYPRFFEMVNDTVEAFFAELGHPFAAIHAGGAVPTAEITMEFHAPVRLGENLTLTLAVTHLGRSSLGYRVAATAPDPRFTARATLVHTAEDLRPAPWPQPLRAALAPHLETSP